MWVVFLIMDAESGVVHQFDLPSSAIKGGQLGNCHVGLPEGIPSLGDSVPQKICPKHGHRIPERWTADDYQVAIKQVVIASLFPDQHHNCSPG